MNYLRLKLGYPDTDNSQWSLVDEDYMDISPAEEDKTPNGKNVPTPG